MERNINELCQYLSGILSFRDFIKCPSNVVDGMYHKNKGKIETNENRFSNKRNLKEDNRNEALEFFISQREFERGNVFLLAQDEVESGLSADQAGSALRRDVVRNWIKKNKELKQFDDESEKQDLVDVILVPKFVRILTVSNPERVELYKADKEAQHKQKHKHNDISFVSLFYVKAQFNTKTGELSPIKGDSVVWAHPLLENKDEQNKGKLRLFNFDTADDELQDQDNWSDYFSMVNKHFEKCTGIGLFKGNYLMDNHGAYIATFLNVDHKQEVLMMYDETVFATFHIEKLLSEIQVYKGNDLSLFQNMVFGGRSEGWKNKLLGFFPSKINGGTQISKVGENIARHKGQMKNEYPLADAQRQVVHAVAEMKNGQVLAVSGPPGTGKTTVLQSVVAQMIVSQTLEMMKSSDSDKVPSLKIIATSANNQAITNIIDAFANSASESNTDSKNSDYHIHSRWIKYVKSEGNKKSREYQDVPMATYFPASSKIKEAGNKYFISDAEGGQHYGGVMTYYASKPNVFVSRASKVLGLGLKCYNQSENAEQTKIFLSEIKSAIAERINICLKHIEEVVALSKRRSMTNELILRTIVDYGYLCNNAGIPAQTDRLEVYTDRLLDKTIRFELYWLAVHYNECVWMERILKRKENEELMNVAVSRAKDHFIVFGSRECLLQNRSAASCGILLDSCMDITGINL